MIKILFVCLGNICRSPSGEAVMNELIRRENLQDKISCDSAGTIAYHEGNPADSRMKTHAIKRGYNLTSMARKFNEADFEKFDYIIAMDESNYNDLLSYDINNKYKSKIFMMTDFSTNNNFAEVPDPYYGGPEGFETVLDILEDTCAGLLEDVKTKLNNNLL
ncbi:MAG: low molecular weight phosphotyrosine protein phosphatase [Ignavibacteriae bacterium]|nr:low molecular weight phosphotyrosine protein phosphatase [Ignavibacteriota bacterium]NOG96829.1 low molecular weight phosphotyrosine protein phosphatase [Ignavibacteriota bacterium]